MPAATKGSSAPVTDEFNQVTVQALVLPEAEVFLPISPNTCISMYSYIM